MALRPYDHGNAGAARRAGAEPPRRANSEMMGGGALMPFGFGAGHDPFAGFGADPFAGGGFGRGGSIMQRFDDMSRHMAEGFGGQGGRGLMGGAQLAMPGDGQYSCQTFAMSSVMGPDGKMRTERFSSSDVGNAKHGIRESQHTYANSHSGIDKMGLERHVGGRGRKMVKELNRNTKEEKSTEMFRGMDESGKDAFDREFGSRAQHLPQHARFSGHALPGYGGHGALPTAPTRQTGALPSSASSSSYGHPPQVRRH